MIYRPKMKNAPKPARLSHQIRLVVTSCRFGMFQFRRVTTLAFLA